MSKSKRSPSLNAAASMSEFMRSTQATNSPRSVGRVGSRMRWMATPAAASSAGGSSPPRVGTWTSTPRSTSPSESLRTWRARPPSISGGYSQERISTRVIEVRWCRGSGLSQRGQAEVRGQGSPSWLRFRARVYGLQHALGVLDGAHEGVVAGLAPAVEERPVAGLDGEQLAGGAFRGAVIQAGADRPQQPQLHPPRGPGEIGNPGRVPGPQVLLLTPARGDERARHRLLPGA